MHTLTLQVTNATALKTIHSLELKQLIKIVDDADLSSPSMLGSPLSLKAFKRWVADAECMPSVSLKDAKTRWTAKRKQLRRLSK